MSNIIPFEFEGSAVRSTVIDGEPWFVAADICRVLEVQNPSDTVAKLLDDDERGVASIYTPSGNQEMIIVSESGLYCLILRGRKATTPGTPQHRFRKWVTSEVLPAIRKTGDYIVVDNGDAPAVDLQSSYTVCEAIIRPDGQWGRIWAIPVYRIQGVDYWNVHLVLEAYCGQRRIPDNVDFSEYACDLMQLHPELMGAAPLWVACLERLEVIVKLVGGCWDDRAHRFVRALATAMPNERMAIGNNLILPHSPTHH